MTLTQREKFNLIKNTVAFLETVSPYLDDLVIHSEKLDGTKPRCNDGGTLADMFAEQLSELADDYV
jgi:hypothetical protein